MSTWVWKWASPNPAQLSSASGRSALCLRLQHTAARGFELAEHVGLPLGLSVCSRNILPRKQGGGSICYLWAVVASEGGVEAHAALSLTSVVLCLKLRMEKASVDKRLLLGMVGSSGGGAGCACSLGDV